MLGNFEFCNPTKLYFGDKSLTHLNSELLKYGLRILVIYSSDFIKKKKSMMKSFKSLKEVCRKIVHE